MKTKSLMAGWVVAALLAVPGLARAESAQESFAKGETLLAKADFSAALEAFSAAARADRTNQEYMQHYAMVRRVISLRTRFESEQDPQQWEYLARALRAFYASERIYPEILALDQKLHARLNNAESAVMLAETQLSMEQNAEAVKTLSSLPAGQADAASRALLGIALARTGKRDETKQIAAAFALPEGAGPGLAYAAARLHGAAGDAAKALQLLKTCLEAVPASRQEGFQTHARTCPEFAAMASTADFAAALATPSKVHESKCSGGSSCAGCPMSGKCPKSQAQNR
jgi:tetratricopeptide (TPR) repeat protein